MLVPLSSEQGVSCQDWRYLLVGDGSGGGGCCCCCW